MEAKLQNYLVDDLKKVEHHVNQLIDNIIASGRLEDFSKDIEEVEQFFNYWRHHATPKSNNKKVSP